MSRLIIFCNRAALAKDLTDLFEAGSGVDVIGWEKDLEEAVRRIGQIRPEMVIVAGNDDECQPSPEVKRILQEYRQVSVIGMNLPSKTICIYRAHESMTDSLEELLGVIETSNMASDCSGDCDGEWSDVNGGST